MSSTGTRPMPKIDISHFDPRGPDPRITFALMNGVRPPEDVWANEPLQNSSRLVQRTSQPARGATP